MNQLLDNITWFTLTGPHAVYASGTKDARRYAAGFSPIVGFADRAPALPENEVSRLLRDNAARDLPVLMLEFPEA